ncbi:hypothetical protein FKM82_012092 [Ascaphus truei]
MISCCQKCKEFCYFQSHLFTFLSKENSWITYKVQARFGFTSFFIRKSFQVCSLLYIIINMYQVKGNTIYIADIFCDCTFILQFFFKTTKSI